jgi:hypothetical protein
MILRNGNSPRVTYDAPQWTLRKPIKNDGRALQAAGDLTAKKLLNQ